MCFRTICIVTDHIDTTFQKQSVFVLRYTHISDTSHVAPLSKNFSVLYITQAVHCHRSCNVKNQLHALLTYISRYLIIILHVSNQ
jgi:hypothetical protein